MISLCSLHPGVKESREFWESKNQPRSLPILIRGEPVFSPPKLFDTLEKPMIV